MMAEKSLAGRLFSIFFFFTLIFSLAGIIEGATIVVKPGNFDHFTLQVPDKTVAGENFVIRIQAFDVNNNLITNFAETGKSFRIQTSNSATIQPSVLNAASFSGGSANVTLNSKKAETILLSIQEAGGTVPVISTELTIYPNKLDHFNVEGPQKVIAGEKFDLRITAKDLFDNTVDDMNIGSDIKFSVAGTSTVKSVDGSFVDFKSGMGTASFVSEKVGSLVIQIQEATTGSIGKSGEIVVNPGALASFKIQAPKNAVAGKQFDLLVAAYDVFGNIVMNYSATGNGVILTSTGNSKVEPSAVAASEFRDGQATVQASYEKAETIQIIVKESNRDQSGTSSDISVSNSDPDHFVVVTPQTAVSGQRFKVKVEAYDRFNNPARNYNLIGNEVLLTTSGTGTLSNPVVYPSDFVNGVASVDVSYDKAESFLLSASMIPGRAPGRITLKEPEKMKDVPGTETRTGVPVREVSPSPPVEELSEPVETPPVKTEKAAPKKKPKSAKTDAASAAHKKARETADVRKSPAEMPAPDKQIPVEKTEPPVRAEQPQVVPDQEETKPAEIARAEEPRAEKPAEVFTIRNVSIIEAQNKSLLVFNLNNPNGSLEYRDEIVSRYGKEWLKLTISPANYSTNNEFQFGSAFVGKVVLEEDRGKRSVDVFVELIPAGVTFDIARVKNNLIITLATP